MIRPIDSEQRIPLRTDGRTDGRGESDNPPKFSIKNCRGAKRHQYVQDLKNAKLKLFIVYTNMIQ